MPRHGEPESRTKNIIVWFFMSVVLVVLLGASGSYIYNKLFGTEQAVANDESIQDNKDKQDAQNDPVSVDVVDPGKMWMSWLSSQVLDVPQDAPDYGFPGSDVAINVGRPASGGGGGHLASAETSVTIDLTGRHNTPVRVTGFRAVIDERKTPPDGTIYFVRPQGDSPKGEVDFDLGRGTDAVEGEQGGRPYLAANTVTLAKDETVGFVGLMSVPANTDISYHFEFEFDSGETVRVYNNGESFRLVSYPETVRRAYMNAFESTADGGFGEVGIFPCTWPDQCEEYANNRAPN